MNDIAGVRGQRDVPTSPAQGTRSDRAASADEAATRAATHSVLQSVSQAAAADLFTAISVIRRTARRVARNAWARQPLPPAQSELLRLAAARPGLTVTDAATELRLAPNTVSTLVGRLTDAGLLNRERSAQDGRTALLTTTDQANQRLAEFRDLRAELAGRALAQLQETDQQALAAAVPALLRLAEEMERPAGQTASTAGQMGSPAQQLASPAEEMGKPAEQMESL